MDRHHRFAALAAGIVIAGATVGVGGGSVDAQDTGCEPPYDPVASFSAYPSGRHVDELDQPAVSIDLLGSTQELVGGEIEPGFLVQEVLVTRPTGELRLRVGTEQISGLSAGDLDDDGVDEIWVGNAATAYVVPGTTPDGSYDAASVGIRVRGGPAVAKVGGYFGDDAYAQIVFTDIFTEGTTEVVSATALMAAGPGGDATGLPTVASAPGVPLALLGYREPQYLFGRNLPEESGRARLWSYSADRTETAQFRGEQVLAPSQAVEGADGRFFAISSQDRSAILSVWSYDAPCTPLQVVGGEDAEVEPTTTSAVPTGPTGTKLSFTG